MNQALGKCVAIGLTCLLAWLANSVTLAGEATVAAVGTEDRLEVVFETGTTVPGSQHLAHLLNGDRADSEQLADVRFPLHSRLKSAVLVAVMAPVFDTRWMTMPVFVLGSDRASQQWLVLNRDHLRASGAVGIVVDAPSAQAFKAMQALARQFSLLLVPATGAWLEQRLIQAQVDAYPVLIRSDGRAVQILGETPEASP